MVGLQYKCVQNHKRFGLSMKALYVLAPLSTPIFHCPATAGSCVTFSKPQGNRICILEKQNWLLSRYFLYNGSQLVGQEVNSKS